jgi:hypothetical protein
MRTTKALRMGQIYYSPCPARRQLFCKLKWEGSEFDYLRLTRGLVHTTPTSAVKQAAGMLSISLEE